MNTLNVELGDRTYPIVFASDYRPLHSLFSKLESENTPYAVIIDEALKPQFDGFGHDSLVFEVPSGEPSKSFDMLSRICEFLAVNQIPRDGKLVAIGGGVAGDLAGFAAASYLRGIDFMQVPTTLLAMVDSSVGGKTGINLEAGKNLAGAFWQPKSVIISTDFLKTLPEREFSAGMAEVIKYGMLYDVDLFEKLESLHEPLNWEHPELSAVIRLCCEIKATIVRADEKETAKDAGRALLNLGHTFAHAIENTAGYGTVLHGEAVAIGLSLAAKLSARMTAEEMGGLAFVSNDCQRIDRLLERYNLSTDLSGIPALALGNLMAALYRDKKVRGGKLRFVVMESLGKAVTRDGIPDEWIRELWLEAGAKE